MRCVLACDLGGSTLRLALFDAAARPLAIHSVPARPAREGQGCSEVDPRLWWEDFSAGVEALARAEPAAFAAVDAVAISALTRTQVLVDAQGEPVRPAILFADTRAEPLLAALRGRCPPAHPELRELNAFHPLARLAWVAQAEPAAWARVAHVLEPKDWLNLRLTGVVASDRVSMARLAAAARAPSLFSALGIEPGLVPPLLPPTAVTGVVQPGLPGALARLAGARVMAMANDTWASVVGLGALRPGYAYNLSGTTEVFGTLAAEPAHAEGLLTVEWGDALHQLGGPGLNGADALAWVAGLLAGTGEVKRDLAALLAAPPDAEPVLFLPFLRGERVPYWDPALRGAFLGLNRRHGPADLVRAVLQGIALQNREVLERAEAGTGARVHEVRFGGGGATNALWCQIKADVLGRPIVVTGQEEHGLLGAAIVALVAVGAQPSLAQAQQALVRCARRFEPDPTRHRESDRLFALFRQAVAALRPISHALVREPVRDD